MANACTVVLIGRVLRPVRLETTRAGIQRADFAIAYNPRALDPETGRVEEAAVFIDAVAVGKPGSRNVAELVSRMKKGEQHYFTGKILMKRLEDRDTGKVTNKLYLWVESVAFLDPRSAQYAPLEGDDGDG
jgi:single-stranded DNA-binding protein